MSGIRSSSKTKPALNLVAGRPAAAPWMPEKFAVAVVILRLVDKGLERKGRAHDHLAGIVLHHLQHDVSGNWLAAPSSLPETGACRPKAAMQMEAAAAFHQVILVTSRRGR